MSQVTFKTVINGKRVEVMAGWDRPLRHYFLTVFDMDASDDEPETVWSTIDFPSAGDSLSTVRLEAKLLDMGIQAPEGFWERAHRQEGNVCHTYDKGAWTTP